MTHVIPIFSDNYVFIVVDPATREAVVVDPGSAAYAIQFIKTNQLTLKAAFITHQHSDHIDGLAQLLEFEPGLIIFAPEKHKAEIKLANKFISDGEVFQILGAEWKVMQLQGHTQGHIAYYNSTDRWLFSGDVIFGLGGGRLFEGSFEDMWKSFQRLRSLPPETLIFCAHEYTAANFNFCQQLLAKESAKEILTEEILQHYENTSGLKSPVTPEAVSLAPAGHQALKSQTIPLLLRNELQSNPFFLARDVNELKTLRLLRNQFIFREA